MITCCKWTGTNPYLNTSYILQFLSKWRCLLFQLDIYNKEELQMKLTNLLDNNPRPKMKIIITTEQFHRLATSVINLMEQEQIIKTYLIKKRQNGKQFN
jgi:hypothetical protein